MVNRREAIQQMASISAVVGIAGCIGRESSDSTSESNNNNNSDSTSESNNNNNNNVPTFRLPQCSSSTFIQITRIDGYEAVIKNTDVNTRAVRFSSYTDSDEYGTGTDGWLGDNPITEYYVVEAGSTLGVDLPETYIGDNGQIVSPPIDRLEVNTASIDDNGRRGEFESAGCINPDDYEYNGDIHELKTSGEENSSEPVLDFTIGVSEGTQDIYYVAYIIQLDEDWLENNPSPEFEVELELPSGDTLNSTPDRGRSYIEGDFSNVWTDDEYNGQFTEETRYKLNMNGEEIINEICSEGGNRGIGYGCRHSITTDDV